MADRLYLKPTDPGSTVRFPPPLQDRVLPAEGQHVPDGPYWRRRLKAGEVAIARPPRATKKEG